MNIPKRIAKERLDSHHFYLQSKATSWLLSIALIGLALCGGSSASAAANKIGSFTVVAGSVDALREQTDAPIAAEIGMDAFLDDIVRTKRRSRTQLRFLDNSVLNMGADHMVKIKDFVYDEENGIRKAILSSLRGTVRVTVSKLGVDADSVFEVETPTAVASVRGTDFIVKVNSALQTEIIVLEGAVQVRNANPKIAGTVMVTAGNKTTIPRGGPPTPVVQVPPQIQGMLVAETMPVPNTQGRTVPPVASQGAVAQGSNGDVQAANTQFTTSPSAIGGLAGTPPAFSPASVALEIAPIAPPPPLPVAPPAPTFFAPTVVATGGQSTAGPPSALPPVQPPVTVVAPATVPISLNLVF